MDERDPNNCILKIRLTDAVLLNNGYRYDIEFDESKEEIFHAYKHTLI